MGATYVDVTIRNPADPSVEEGLSGSGTMSLIDGMR